jgi:hypothetical protein
VELGPPRWDGKRGRLEVWYATVTDPATGLGLWAHAEVVAPTDDAQAPYAHGWFARFPPDAPPVVERFGPEPVAVPPAGLWFRAAGVEIGPGRWSGAAETTAWDLRWDDDSDPLFTFPRWAWSRDVLPGAQIVPWPDARFAGTVATDGRETTISAGRGGVARIYGHGNAQRWGWLHADLDGDGVLEIVAAVPRRPGLRRMPPVPMVQLRVGGDDWPAEPLLAAARFRARLGLPVWTVKGVSGDRRIHVTVELPPDLSARVAYRDPDGAPATCTNSERASATVVVEARQGRTWSTEARWELRNRAHAEIGTRP